MDPTLDPSELTESQQVALGTYTSVTNQDPAAAIPLLRRSEWNVQIAIAKFFDGEAPDPVEEARAAQASSPPPPSYSPRRETLLNGSPSYPQSPRSLYHQPAPRIVPQRPTQTNYNPPLLLQIIFTPFNLLTRLVGGSFSLIGYILSFIPRLLPGIFVRAPSPRIRSGRRPLNPRDTAARFVREFEEDYGTHGLHFFEGGYASAYDLAKKDLKFLLVVLLSAEHDDTSTFVRETLLSDAVTNYINGREDIILWAGNVQDSEAYQVSAALNCSKFPFSAVVAHTPQDSSTAMSTIARVTGLITPSAFVAQLQRAIDQQAPHLARVRAQRSEREATRNLRAEQNSAYERSLAQDRERARQRREAVAAQVKADEEARTKAEAANAEARKKEQWKRWKASQIAPEPGSEVKEAPRVSIRLPSGQRVVRRFDVNATLEDLYAFVECFDMNEESHGDAVPKPEKYEHTYNFRLVSPMPRTVYEVDEGDTISKRVGRSANLIVETIDEDEQDD